MHVRFYSMLVVSALVVTCVSPSITYAVDDTGTDTPTTTSSQTPSVTQDDVKEKMQMLRSDMIAQKKAMKDELQEQRAEMKEKMDQQKATLKTRLSVLKDEMKRKAVEGIHDKIATISANHTDRWSTVLDNLQEELDGLTEKTETVKSSGKSVVAVESQITVAQASISAAKSAVTAQSGKTYVLTVTSDETVKSTVGVTVKTFRTDMEAVQKKVADARLATAKVMSVLTQADSPATGDASESAESETSATRINN